MSARTTGDAPARFVEVTVADRGPGFRPGEELKVFEKFHRGGGTDAPGAGLGLAIVRGVLRVHGGSVEAHNRDGGGAEIVLRIPDAGGAPKAPTEAAA